MKKKKIMAALLTVCMAGSMLAGCGSSSSGSDSSGDDTSAAEETTASEETTESEDADDSAAEESSGGYQTTYGDKIFDDVTITVELFDRSNAPEGSTLTDNRWVEYVNEQMNKVGITVEFVAVPRSDEVTKMQTMVASGTAPDITITYTYSYAEDYYNQGGIWDLSEFIDGEGQAENMKAYIGEDVIDLGRNGSGELYGIVAKRATTAQHNLFIRKDLLDELGLDLPGTVDELYEAIEAMVEYNPDSLAGVIGYKFVDDSGVPCRSTLSLAFSQLGDDPKEHAISSGYEYYYDGGFREYIRFLNKLYNNGLMDAEFFTSTEDTFTADIVNGSLFCFEANVNYSVDVLRGSLLQALQENDPDADIVSLEPLENVNDGNQYSGAYSAGGLIAFCPKTADAETVEACMVYLDWLCTEEGGYTIYHGFEGEHYELDENNVPIPIDSDYNADDKDWIRTDLFLTGNQGYFATVDDFNVATAAENPGYEDYVIDNYENALAGIVISSPSYTAPSAADLATDLSLAVSEWSVICITCAEEDFDDNYDAYMEECEKIGIQTIIDERTEYFTEMYGY